PAALADYVALVRAFNGGEGLKQYPGSPAFAQMLLRPDDRMRLYELHPTDHRILQAYLGHHPNTQVAQGDGFAALKGELPPPSRRGVLLIDPSYELKTDYVKVLAAVREALTRFAECVILVWIPQLQLVESAQLPHRLQAAGRLRRRCDQGGAARRRRSAAQMAPAARGHQRVVAGAKPQQEERRARSAQRRGPRRGARAGGRGRRADRELQARHAGEMGPRLRGLERGQPGPDHAAHQRLRAKRPLQGSARLRSRCRSDGRP